MATLKRRARIVGSGTVGLNVSTRVYEALDRIVCGACDAVIEPGEHFIRKKLIGGGVATYAVCRFCFPFREGN